ncbi:MAG: domain containing protein [Verrucomicrobiales bacterium]|nr:domain containing protein [Verrucomicrobiales bacterium]
MAAVLGIILLNIQEQQPEPSYDGHPFSCWLTELKNNHREDRYDGHTMAYWMSGNPNPNAPYWDNTNVAGNAAEAAIRAIGTNALPALIERIKSRPGHTAQMAESLGKKIGVHFRSAQDANRRADEAVYAFGFLGSNALPAIGPLSNMVCNPNNYILTSDCTEALMRLGEPGVKTLVSILADPSVRWRSTISYHITDCRPQELEIMIAALANLTNDSNKHLREACASNLQLLNRRSPKNH